MSLPDFEVPIGDDAVDPFARRIAVVIAAATLLAAVAGFLQNEASSENGTASLRAQQHAIDAAQSLVLAEERARVSVDAWSTSLEQRVRAANIGQQLLYAPEAERTRLEAERQSWTALADRTEVLSGIDRTALEGPDRDPTFPSRLLADRTRDAVRLEALQDAANEVGEAWSDQATTYTAVLAILAVALYLLGFSLTVGVRQARRLFAGVGVVLALVAGGWTGAQVATRPAAAADEAADAYADGMIALDTAFDAAGYRSAVADLTRAIELRPTFARAYLGRATAEFALGSPQHEGFLSIVTDEALATSSDDLARARGLGLDDTALIADLGFQRFLQGIRGSAPALQESVRLSTEAIARTPGDPVVRFNLGVALLAAGRLDEARAAYDDGIARVIYVDVAAGVRRDDAGAETAYVAGALTDLEILGAARPEVAEALAGMRSVIVGSVARGAIGPTGGKGADAGVDRLAADVFPSLVQWRGDISGLDGVDARLSVIWSRKDPGGTEWAVMPDVSVLDAAPTENVNPDEGSHFGLSRYIGATVPPRCLPDGTYRVELFVDGRPIGRTEATASSGLFEAFAARDLGAAFCRPAGWTRDPQDELGTSAGFIAPEGDRGAGVIHLQAPRLPIDDADLLASLMDAAVDGMEPILGSAATYDEAEGTTDGYFMGLSSTRWRWYDYDGGFVRIGAGLDPDGGVYIGLAYGPTSWFDGDEWMRIVESFETFE
jgi:tetratricopeptide (TPR) repeat protein